ncbi:MAG: tetratricopeptide repeat protein [Flavobacteriales bacterium]|nr:tetratricopeptide repeat protein [Flavobacteriales bacterium]
MATFLTINFNAGTSVDAILNDARKELQENMADEALDKLIQSIMRNKQAYDEIARRVCIALFHRWGDQHPLTLKYRRRFNMALY